MAGGILSPFKVPIFRRIWPASLLSNFGILIQGVGSAWAMTRLTSDATMVALVQTAVMLPIMLIALPAGAISDMFDRRVVCMTALSVALCGAIGLCILTVTNHLTPLGLLCFSFLVGSGMAMYGPSWQASVAEQVPLEALPSAIALNGISYNVARSFGPAIGGIAVATVGAIGAFVTNAVCYIPLLVVLALWRRPKDVARLPPETFARAILSGVRFILYSPSHRTYVVRALLFAVIGSVVPALLPLIARDLLGGGAPVYGLLLGAFGVGAVLAALSLSWTRARLTAEAASRLSAVAAGSAILIIAFSRLLPLTLVALLVAGMSWTNALTRFSIAVQIAAPRWVAGRALAIYQSTVAGGVALGSWGWGTCADHLGLPTALSFAGAAMLLSALTGAVLRLSEMASPPILGAGRGPEIALQLTPRSGPIVTEIDYVVPTRNARAFYTAMTNVRRYRQRAGAYGWSIARDILDPTLWKERFHSPTWHDYLHLVERGAAVDQVLSRNRSLLEPGAEPRARRFLEGPDGFVRWQDDAPDPKIAPAGHDPLT